MRKIKHKVCRPADDANSMVYKTHTIPATSVVHNVTAGEGYIYDIVDMLYSAIEDA